MRMRNSFLLILIVSLFIISCSANINNMKLTQNEKDFYKMFPDVIFGQDITLELDTDLKMEIPPNTPIDLLIKNLTNSEIEITLNQDVYSFANVNGKWELLENFVTYAKKPAIIDLAPYSSLGWIRSISIDPIISTPTQINFIRVAVVGEILKEDSSVDEKVGTYLDIPILP